MLVLRRCFSGGSIPSWAPQMQKYWSPAGAYWAENHETGARYGAIGLVVSFTFMLGMASVFYSNMVCV